jgi:hypothetical protein
MSTEAAVGYRKPLGWVVWLLLFSGATSAFAAVAGRSAALD